MALFIPSEIGNTEGHAHLVEMRAGKMFRQGTWVYPDNRRGSIYVYRSSDDLMHFCWRERQTFLMEDDFIVFPGDCTYLKVKQCITGRVYVLKFENSTVRMFYWLQEPKTDKDDEHCRRINYLLNHSSVHHTSPLPFNITQAQLSSIFGPEVAAQLSAIMNNEENHTLASGYDSDDKTQNNQDNTPLSEGNTSVSDGNNVTNNVTNMSMKKKSSLKSDAFVDIEKKQAKSVTIFDDVQTDPESRNVKNKARVTVTDEILVLDYIEEGNEDDQSDEYSIDESNTDYHDDETKD